MSTGGLNQPEWSPCIHCHNLPVNPWTADAAEEVDDLPPSGHLTRLLGQPGRQCRVGVCILGLLLKIEKKHIKIVYKCMIFNYFNILINHLCWYSTFLEVVLVFLSQLVQLEPDIGWVARPECQAVKILIRNRLSDQAHQYPVVGNRFLETQTQIVVLKHKIGNLENCCTGWHIR